MSSELVDRREAVRRVTALLGGLSLVGGSTLIAACQKERAETTADANIGEFTSSDIALLDEIAETILPATSTPGAKAAKTGAFMALMVTDTYEPKDQKIFRDGMKKLDEASQKANSVSFMASTAQQRLALLEVLDREQKQYTDARQAARERSKGTGSDTAKTAEAKKSDAFVPGQRKEGALGTDAGPAAAITADAPSHYFRMMKELAMLGYFTSEIGCTQALRYVESPGRFDPCVPYKAGEKSWAPHA
jgi:hypothetical protein